jgi:hypothetical protein
MIENAKKIEAELKALEQKKEEAKKALEQKIAEEEKILLEEKTNEKKVLEEKKDVESFCIKCKTYKNESAFYTNYRTGEPRGSCKECSNKANREHNKKIKEDLASGKNECKKCNNVYPYFRLFYKKLDGTNFEDCIECYNKQHGKDLAQCYICFEIKDKDLFQKEKIGFRHRCKSCHNKKARIAYLEKKSIAIR